MSKKQANLTNQDGIICPRCKSAKMSISLVNTNEARSAGRTFAHFFFGTWLFALVKGRSQTVKKVALCPNCGNSFDLGVHGPRKRKGFSFTSMLFVLFIVLFLMLMISRVANGV